MEYDRYKANHKIYIIAVSSLLSALVFLFFSLYILPYLIWELHYHVPAVVVDLIATLEDDYEFNPRASKVLVWLLFFVPSMILGYIAYYTANRIDNSLYRTELPDEPEALEKKTAEERNEDLKESAGIGVKIILLMLAVILGLFLLQTFVQATA